MATIKKYNGSSWENAVVRKLGTSTDTITTLPADVYADGNNATVGLKGNMQQTGTPTPSNPVEVNGVGERTGNLFDKDKQAGNIYVTESIQRYGVEIPVEAGIYTIVGGTTKVFVKGKYGTTYDTAIDTSVRRNITLPQNGYILIYAGKAEDYDVSNIMLNSGTTPLPYEPYGYKILISSANATTPVYLGEVETTRKIRKLVLRGNEIILRDREREGSWRFFTDKLISAKGSAAICSHFENIGTDGVNNSDNIGFSIFNNAQFGCRCPKSIADTATDFKSYLAAQYAAGTPVTVWYVLATPETAVVNKPLMRIGDYADTVSGISVPTITGKDSFDVETTLKPSEVSLSYTGWHDASVKEWDGSDWS